VLKVVARLQVLGDLPARHARVVARDRSRSQIQFRMSPAVRAQLAAAYVSGSTIAEIQQEFGLGKASVSKLLRQESVEIRHHPLAEELLAEAIKLYKTGRSIREVAAELGAAKTTVRESLVKAGVVLRPAVRVVKHVSGPVGYDNPL
jgi:transposase-like protein